MKEIIVSVIVPMYNVEKYAAECIESIVSQTYKQLEIILVNDGSTDSTLAICEGYASRDGRITVLNKGNGGPTECRLTGLKESHGEYVYFADSDDILSPQLVEKLLSACLENDAEVAVCGYRKFGAEESDFPVKAKANVIEKTDFASQIVLPSISPESTDETIVFTFYWNHIYKANCLSEDCFISDKICTREDTYTNLMILDRINRIAVVGEILYNYRMNMDSLTVAYRKNKLEKDLYFISFAENFVNCRGLVCERRLESLASGIAYGNIDNFCKSGSYALFRSGIKKMLAEEGFAEAIMKSLTQNISRALKISGKLYSKRLILPLYLFRRFVLRSKGIL